MKLLRYWKVVVGLTLVFAAGVVSGSVATHQMLKRGFARALNFQRWKTGVVHVLQSKLSLTPEQRQKIAVLVDQRGQEVRGEFSRTFQESGRIMVQLQKEIDQELTPQQRAIHDRMKREFRAELKKRFNYDLPEE
jgi:hypothetical protein